MVVDLIREALRYPLRRIDALAAGWVLELASGILLRTSGVWPLALVPQVLVVGYALRVIAASSREDPRPPAFSGWVRLAADGLLGLAVAAAYLFVPAIVLLVTAGGLSMGRFTDPTVGATPLVVVLGATAVLAILLVFGYVFPAAVAAVATDGRARSAAQFERLGGTVRRVSYLVGWATTVGLVLVGGSLTAALLRRPGITTVAGLFVAFYVQISAAYLVGRSVAGSSGPVPTPAETS